MKIVEHINKAKGETILSFEIIPPLKGDSINLFFNTIESLLIYKPSFVDVTYHREEYILKKKQDGLLEKVAIRKRPGTVGICAAIKHRYNIDPVPHIICGGFSKEETENALIDLNFLEIDNVLVLRGDAIKSEQRFYPHPEGHKYASDLLIHAKNMNNGKYLNESIKEAQKTNFCLGVAGYPEKHFEAPNLKTDIKYLKKKIELGADYVVTQMFFDNNKYFEFVNLCRKEGINVPIIPGLKPISSFKHLNILPHLFHIDIPEELTNKVMACKDDKEVFKVGVDWCIKQSEELKKAKVPCLHYYSMNKSDNIEIIVKNIFPKNK